MLYKFPAQESVDFEFKMTIAGSSKLPSSVNVCLQQGDISLCFAAQSRDGENWVAQIDRPGAIFSSGDIDLRINVIVNNQHYSPIKALAQIIGKVTEDASLVTELPVIFEHAVDQSAEQIDPVGDPVGVQAEDTCQQVGSELLKLFEPENAVAYKLPPSEIVAEQHQQMPVSISRTRVIYR